MRCPFCGSNMESDDRLTAVKTWQGRTLTFHGVRGWKCPACGEQAYEAGEVERMERVCESEEARCFAQWGKRTGATEIERMKRACEEDGE